MRVINLKINDYLTKNKVPLTLKLKKEKKIERGIDSENWLLIPRAKCPLGKKESPYLTGESTRSTFFFLSPRLSTGRTDL